MEATEEKPVVLPALTIASINQAKTLDWAAVPTTLIEGDPKVYKYHPQSTLALGRGFVPNDILSPRRSAISFSEKPLDAGTPSTSFRMIYVRTEDQLDFSMKLDSKAEAAYLGAKAEGSSTFAMGFQIKSDSIVIVMTAASDFGRWGMSQERLSDEAKQMLGDPKAFVEAFGNRYVSIERRGAMVSAIVIMDAVDIQARSDFETEFGGQGGWGEVATASAKTKLSLMMKLSSRQGRLSTEVMASGGVGLAGLKDLVKGVISKNDNPLAEVQDALAQYLSGFDKNNASPIEYIVAPMSQFGLDEKAIDPWTDERERDLLSVAREYRLVAEAIDVMPLIKSGKHVVCTMDAPEVITAIVKAEQDLHELASALAKYHKNYQKNSSAYFPSPSYNVDVTKLIQLLRWSKQSPALEMDAYPLNSVQVQSVLREKPGGRLALAKRFNPNFPYDFLQIDYLVDAAFTFHSVSLEYQYLGGDPSETTELPWSGRSGLLWSREPSIAEERALEDGIFDYLEKHNGTFDLLISLKLRDKVGNAYRVGLVHCKFTAGRGAVTALDWNVLF